jgi:hypothetical protein
VRDARDAKHIPIGALNCRLIANQQGRNQPSPTWLGHGACNACAQSLACLRDGVLPSGGKSNCRRVFQAISHMAAGMQTLRPEPQLGIKTTRVGQSMGSLQAHAELP